MSTLYPRHSKLDSKIDRTEDIALNINGFSTIIEYSYHAIQEIGYRSIYVSAVTHIIQMAFDELLDLKYGDKFMITDNELGLTVVGVMEPSGLDIIIPIVSVIDSARPTNPHGTLIIAV